MKRFLFGLAVAATAFAYAANIQGFGHTWQVPELSDWSLTEENGSQILHLVTGHEPLPGPRRPFQFALCEMPPASRVTLEADVRPLKRSLILIYAYKDPAHFNYAHLSTDTGEKQPVHNGIFHVFGGERVRISTQAGRPAFAGSNRWYHVKLDYDGTHGTVDVLVDNQPVPALRAVDLSLAAGRIGIGSFDETGDFKNVKFEASNP